MALLLLRHALSISDNEGDDDASTMFSVSLRFFFSFDINDSVGTLCWLKHSISQWEFFYSMFFQLFLLRAAGFLLPCYIMAWIFSILHRRRQREVCQANLLFEAWYKLYGAVVIIQKHLTFWCFNYPQEAASIAAAEVAFILQSAQGRALQFTIAPDSPTTPQHEPHHQHQQQQPQQ